MLQFLYLEPLPLTNVWKLFSALRSVQDRHVENESAFNRLAFETRPRPAMQ